MLMHRHGLAAASASLVTHEAVLAAAAAVALVAAAAAAAAAAVVLVAAGVAALAVLGCLGGVSRASHVSRLREGVLLTSSRCSCSLLPCSARGGGEVERRVRGTRGGGEV